MRPQYVALSARPKGWDDDEWETNERTITVHESDPTPQPTGLLDHTGTPIYRVNPRVKMGYV